MSSSFKRTDRIAEMVQRKLATIIQQEVKDPRLPKFVTISAVQVTADLGHAKVYFTVFNEDHEQVALILNSAASYLRTALARSSKLRTIPQLHFIYDSSIDYGRRLSRLIDDLNPEETEQSNDEENPAN